MAATRPASAPSPLALALALALALVPLLWPTATLAATQAGPTRGGPALRRFALIVSANDGGPGRPVLRFADSDARSVSEVLRSLGGLRDEDTVLLPAVTRGSLHAGFARMKEALARAAGGARRELFVYYSGHSNEEGLLLGRERVDYEELRRFIAEADAEVRIAILDSCASGALIRKKGGTRRASFLQDASIAARGHAFLTASAADEAAQESDRIGGAFFTHYLLSGLRGAADASRDGRVTLGEAYQYAYQETLYRTEKTVGGAQHPNYDIQLAGTGDLLVMTDLRATGAGLLIDESVAGRLYVRDASGRLLVELRKEPLYPVELGLGPGNYRVALDADGRPFEAVVTLENGKTARLSRAQFVASASVVATSRGGAGADAGLAAAAARPPRSYHHAPFELMLAPTVRTGGRDNEAVLNNFAFGLITGSAALEGLQLSLVGNTVEDDMGGAQITGGYNQVGGAARGLQLSGFANLADGGMRGLQVTGGFNRSGRAGHGLQVAGGANQAVGSFAGLQVAGFANSVGGDLVGLQTSIINHTAGRVRGAQVGVASLASGDLDGIQVSVASWLGGQMHGLQVAVLNVGGTVTGAQIGVVNIADRVQGTQIGVVNVANSVSAPIGIFNLVRDGYYALALWSSDLSPTNIGVKMGSRWVYTQLGFGLGRADDDRALMNAQAAIGVHLVPGDGRFFVDFDLGTSSRGTTSSWKEEDNLNTARLVVGYRLMQHLALTAGPTFNVHVHDRNAADQPGLGLLEEVIDRGSTRVRLFPGFAVGMQI